MVLTKPGLDIQIIDTYIDNVAVLILKYWINVHRKCQTQLKSDPVSFGLDPPQKGSPAPD